MTNILKLWVYDRPGVLDTIAGLLRRKGVNISTISASETIDDQSHITISIKNYIDIEKLADYFAEMTFIKKWELLKEETHVIRELVLIKAVKSDKEKIWREGMKVIEEKGDFIFIEFVGTPQIVNTLIKDLSSYNIESVRSGTLGLNF